jgi:hypothetical protein
VAQSHAKSMTNNLPLLSVLVQVALIMVYAGSVMGAISIFCCHQAEDLVINLIDNNFSGVQD